MMRKVGETEQVVTKKGTDCPKCKKGVFKNYPKGYVNEFNVITSIDGDTITWGEHWHCPGCGHWELTKTHTTSVAVENSSDIPKKKKESSR